MKRLPVDLNDPQDVEDELEQIISDSMDMDWTARTGARAIQRWLDDNGFAIVPFVPVRQVVGILRSYEREHIAKAERAENQQQQLERYEKAARNAEAAQLLEGLFEPDTFWKGILVPQRKDPRNSHDPSNG